MDGFTEFPLLSRKRRIQAPCLGSLDATTGTGYGGSEADCRNGPGDSEVCSSAIRMEADVIVANKINGDFPDRWSSNEEGEVVNSLPQAAWEQILAKLLDDEILLKRVLTELGGPGATSAQARGRIVLDPRAPLDIARRFIAQHFRTEAGTRLLHARGKDLLRWNGSHYVHWSAEDARAALYRFLENGVQSTKDGHRPFRPSKSVVTNIEDALRAAAHVASATAAPTWLDGRSAPPPDELVACNNGLLHIPTRTLHPHDPALFATWGLPFAYESEGPEPAEWLRFLDTLWPDDEDAIRTLQEVLGYLVSGETRHQKIFLLVGPKRSGKGTIARITRALLGQANTVGPTLTALTERFGLEPLVNRRLAVISDARLSGRADQAIVTERLLAISGEDVLTVDRKNQKAWTGRLPTRFLVLTNELPRLNDGSGALASRFLMLTMTRSFLGKEDLGLEDRLMQELPGIFRWALDGWDRLRERGHFRPPPSSEEAVRELEDLSSPVSTFLRECCALEPGAETPTDVLYEAWRSWCMRQGHGRISTAAVFGRDLRAVVPGLATAQRASGPDRHRVYLGIQLI